MSLKDTVTSIETHLTEAYNVLEEKGATLPANKNLQNLPATIEEASSGSGGESGFGDPVVELLTNYNNIHNKIINYTSLSTVVNNFSADKDTVDCNVFFSMTGTRLLVPKTVFVKATFAGELPATSYFLGGSNSVRSFANLKEIVINNTTKIYRYFAHSDTSLEKVTLSTPLANVASDFCYDCYKLKTLYIPAGATPPTDNNSLSTANANAPSYKTGITLYGPGAQAWINALPNRTTSPYRKLIYGGESLPGEPVDPPIENPTELTFTNLKSALNSGDATNKFPVGTEIKDTTDPQNPWVVANYGDALLVAGYRQDGVYLCKKYLSEYKKSINNIDGSGSNGYAYAYSTLYKYYNSDEFLQTINPDLRQIVATIGIDCYVPTLGYTNTPVATFFPMSASQIGGVGGTKEGTTWQYWLDRGVPNSLSNSANSGRIVTKPNGEAASFWTRSITRNNNNSWMGVLADGSLSINAYSTENYLVHACFIAKD